MIDGFLSGITVSNRSELRFLSPDRRCSWFRNTWHHNSTEPPGAKQMNAIGTNPSVFRIALICRFLSGHQGQVPMCIMNIFLALPCKDGKQSTPPPMRKLPVFHAPIVGTELQYIYIYFNLINYWHSRLVSWSGFLNLVATRAYIRLCCSNRWWQMMISNKV